MKKQIGKAKKTRAAFFAPVVLAVAIVAMVVLGNLSPAFSVPGGNLKAFQERAKLQYGAAFGKYKDAVNEYRDARQEFFQVRENFLKARRLGGGKDATTNETDVLGAARRYMATSADHLITLIDHVENEVAILTSVNSTDAPELEQLQENWLAQLEAARANVTRVKAEIGNATERQELVSASKELGQVWRDVKDLSQRIYYLARVERGVALYRRISLVESRISNRTAELAAINGTNASEIAEIEAALGQVRAYLSSARESFADARAYFGAGNRGNGKGSMAESQGFLRDALKSLKEAYSGYRNARGAPAEDGEE